MNSGLPPSIVVAYMDHKIPVFGLTLEIAVTKTKALYFSFLWVLFCVSTNLQAEPTQENIIHWAGCGITKKAFMQDLAEAYSDKTNIKIVLEGGGATRGIRDTVDMKIHMGGTCRMALPNANSKEMYANLHPVAWDALAIITHKSNITNNISTDLIRKVFTGKITRWEQLGGKQKGEIHLYVRKSKISGVGYAIRQYIFQDSGVEFKTKYMMFSSGPLEKAVESDPLAIGITGISSARKRNVKIIGFNGKVPTFKNVKNGNYGLYRPLYLVTGTSPSKKVKDFILFASSKKGREIIRDNGTVPYQDALPLMSSLLIYGFGVQ